MECYKTYNLSSSYCHPLLPQVGEGKPGFFAIASPPDPNNQGLLEFLIKAQGEAAEAIAGAQRIRDNFK
jgi:hypothetical protein